MWMWIVGLVLVGVAAVLFFLRRSQAAKLAQMIATETSTCADAAKACRSAEGMSGVPGGGAQVEIKGVIEPREVLKAELSGQDCACYRAVVEREWEEKRWRTDSQGHRRHETHRGKDVMSRNERLDPFLVRDDTGKVLVDPQGAHIDWVESVNRFDRGEPEGGTLSLGGFSLNLGSLALGGGRRTIGYRYREWLLPPDHPVYVLGEAGQSGNDPCIAKPSERGMKFVVSVKSEEEIVAGARRTVFWLSIASAICGLAGIVLIILGLTRG